MFQTIFANVRKACPLVHNITNYVTVNDCANMLLACGASPIMADDEEEVEEITALCAGLNINIGTLNRRTIASMLLVGKRANALGHPVVLDPVGAGASKLRTETAEQLLKEVKFTVIRGNISEIKALAYGSGTTKGVDADVADSVTDENLPEMVASRRHLRRKPALSLPLPVRLISWRTAVGRTVFETGHPMMASITGTGCQLSAMTAAFVAANREQALEAAAAAVAAMGYAGELAYERRSATDGNATYRNGIIDAIYNMTPENLEKGACYEVY